MFTVTVIGPNGINDASFHVHAADCADVQKARYARCEPGMIESVESRQELTQLLWADIMAESDDDDDNWENYDGEQRYFPCSGL